MKNQVEGCTGTMVIASNNHSRKIFDRLGMDVMKEMNWEDIEIEGKRPFTGTKSKSISSHYMKIAKMDL